jgi:hypothetical protein
MAVPSPSARRFPPVALYPSSCVRCGEKGEVEWDWDDDEEGGPDTTEAAVEKSALPDAAFEAQEHMDAIVDSFVADVKAGRHKYLCAACDEDLTARFDCRRRSERGTLLEVLRLADRYCYEAAVEQFDPDVHEVLPDYEVLPASRGLVRELTNAVAALRRVGKPVCYFDPDFERSFTDECGAFFLYSVSDWGEYCQSEVDPFALAELGDVAYALDYAPDGSPLPAAGV